MPVHVSPVVHAAVFELRRRLAEKFGAHLVEVRVFGSYARGEANEDSDVDVFVLLRGPVGFADKASVIDAATELAQQTEVPLSPTVFDLERYHEWLRQERRLVVDIATEGIRI